jgi:hypothetical protein
MLKLIIHEISITTITIILLSNSKCTDFAVKADF